tara:strand:- start:244 stop:465 length:222 start_codon:yes stop_codon:yes gene_type:complete
MKATRKGILLVNLGSPDSMVGGDARKFSGEFLMDGRVWNFPLSLSLALRQADNIFLKSEFSGISDKVRSLGKS